MPKLHLLASDFDQTPSFNDSGHVLSEILGTSGFAEEVTIAVSEARQIAPLDARVRGPYSTAMNERAPGSLSYELLSTMHGVEARLEAALEPLGLSLAKFGALSKLVTAGEPLPLGTLAERCACVRSNITQLVDRLEADKLVHRSDYPHDRRSVRAELTAEGRSRHAAGLRALQDAEHELFAPLSPDRRDMLVQMLRTLRGEP